MKAKVEIKQPRSKKVDTSVVVKVVAIKRYYSDPNGYDEVLDNPEYSFMAWCHAALPSYLHPLVKDSFRWGHRAGLGGGRTRRVGNTRLEPEALKELRAESGKTKRAKRRQQAATKPTHLNVRFALNPYAMGSHAAGTHQTAV